MTVWLRSGEASEHMHLALKNEGVVVGDGGRNGPLLIIVDLLPEYVDIISLSFWHLYYFFQVDPPRRVYWSFFQVLTSKNIHLTVLKAASGVRSPLWEFACQFELVPSPKKFCLPTVGQLGVASLFLSEFCLQSRINILHNLKLNIYFNFYFMASKDSLKTLNLK